MSKKESMITPKTKKDDIFVKMATRTGYRMQINGNQEVVVEGCKGILQYEQEEICLNVGNGQIKVKGTNLSVPVLERHLVQVHGRIDAIEFA